MFDSAGGGGGGAESQAECTYDDESGYVDFGRLRKMIKLATMTVAPLLPPLRPLLPKEGNSTSIAVIEWLLR